MSSRKSKKNQKLGSSRRNKNRNKDIEENEDDDGFPDPGNEKHDSEHSQFSTVSKNQESNEPAQFDSNQPVLASASKNPSELSPHPQLYESKNLTGQAEVTSKKRKMGSTRKSNRELKFGGIYEDEPELGGQLCVEVIKEQGETVEVSIKENSGKEDQTSLSDCAPSQTAEHESFNLQEEDLAHGKTMHNEDDYNNDEHQHLETAIQSKPMDSCSSELNQSKKEEFSQDLIHTSLDFSIFTQTECNVALQESDESLKICHQMDTFTTDHKSSIDTTIPLNENREEGQDVQMSLNNLIHNDKLSMMEQNVLKTMDDHSSYKREDVDTLDSCNAEEKNKVTEVQSAALIDEHDHGTQDDNVATDIWPNVITKASTEDENKDEDHLKKNDDSLNVTKDSSYKSKSRELKEDTDEYKEVSVLKDRNDNDSNRGVATTNLNQAPEPDRNISSPLKLEDQEVGTFTDQLLSNEFKFQAETEIKCHREEQYNVSEANTTSESSADMMDIHYGEKKKYKQTGIEREVENEDVQSTTSNQLLFSKLSSTNMSDFITESELISAERLYGETETSFQTHNLDHNNSVEFPVELESKDRVCSGQMFDNEIKCESLLLNIKTEVIKEKNNDINEEINIDAAESFTKEDFIRVDDEKDGLSTFMNEPEMASIITNRQDYDFLYQASMEVKERGLESPDKGSASPVHAYARNEPLELVPETQVKSDMQMYNAVVVSDQKQNMSEECPVNATNEARMGQNDAVAENVRFSHFEKKEIDSTLSSLSGLTSDSFKAIDNTISVQSLEEVTPISEDATLSFPSETCYHQSSVSLNILEPKKIHENMVNLNENVKDVAKNENTNTSQEYIETPLHITTEVENTNQERDVLDRQDEVTVLIKNICRGVDTTYVLSDVAEHLVDTEVLKMHRETDVAESIVQNEEAESLAEPHQNNYPNFKLVQCNPSECTDIVTFTINTDNLVTEPLDAAEDQINTVLLDEVSSVEGLTELLEQNEQPIVNEEKEAEATHLNEQEMAPIITKTQNDDFTEHVSLAVKVHGNESPDDERASEVNAYTIHGPVELIPQAHAMSDIQINRENIHIVGSDQKQNISEEDLENSTKRESDLDPRESTSPQQYLLCEVSSMNTDLGSSTIEKPSPATEHPDFKEVDKNGIENQGNTDIEMSMQTKKRRKVGSTRRLQGRHQQTKEWKDQEDTEEIVNQIITQAATSILLTEPQNTISEVSSTYDIHDSPMTVEQKETIKSEVQSETEVINTPAAILSTEVDQINTVVSHEGSSVEGLTDVKEQNEKVGVSVKEDAESTLLNEQEMAPIITNITTLKYPTSAAENPDFKEDNVKTVENVENKNTEIHTPTQTKKKKKYGSTRRPHGRQQLHAEIEDGEWKDPENTEKTEQQIISQDASSNMLSEPQSTFSEVSVDINESNLTMEQKEMIKTEVEIRTREINIPPAISSPETDQIHPVVLDEVISVEDKLQNEKPGVNEEKHAASAILNVQEMAPIIKKLDDTFTEHVSLAVRVHGNENADDEHASEVKAYTRHGPVELIPKTHTMSDMQMNTENIHIGQADQNQNISKEHLEKADQINTVILDEVISVEELTDVKEQHEKPEVKEENYAESAIFNMQEMATLMTEVHDDAFDVVKEHVSESADDEHASEVKAYTSCGPVELIPQRHTMSDKQMNTENICSVLSDQNQNIPEEHLRSPTNRESEPEQYESTSPFVQILEPKSSQVDVIKENVEFIGFEKKRKMGSTRKSLRGQIPGIDQKNTSHAINKNENLQEQNMDQKDSNIAVVKEENNDTREKINAGLTENVIKEDITPVSAEQNVLCEVSSLTTDLAFTTIEHPSSTHLNDVMETGENPDIMEDNVNTPENVGNQNAEIHMQTQTKKKKKFGSTRRPHGRQQPQTEGEGGEFKDPENSEEIEHQIIIQASNLLTDPQSTISEVLLDIHDSPLTMEQKEIETESEIETGVIDIPPGADQINTVVLNEENSVEGHTDVEDQNGTGVSVKEDAESTILNEQEMLSSITKIQNDDFTEHVSLAVKVHGNESPDDEHACEVNVYNTFSPVELISQAHTMSDMQMNTENIHIVGSDQNQNISDEHLETCSNNESEAKPCESTSPQQYLLCEVSSINTDLGSSTIEKPSPATEHPDFKEVDQNGMENQGNTDVEMSMQTKKRKKVGSTRRLQGRHQPHAEWKEEWKDLEHTEEIVQQIITQAATSILLTEPQNTISEVSSTYDIHDSPMTVEQKETIKSEVQSETEVINTPAAILSTEVDQINTVVSHEGSSVEGLTDVKEQNEKIGVSVKEDAESTLLNEQEMAPIITNITTLKYPTSAGGNADFKEDNAKTVENVENKNTEIHTPTQTKKKKKYGSTRRPHGRQQLHAGEGEDGEWKDPENTEENEYQIISQAVSSNLLTEPQNTISEVSVDLNDSNLTMEQKEMIKTEVEIGTGEIDTPPAILSPEGDQRNTVVSNDVSSVERLMDIKEQNKKKGVNEEKDAASAILNMQEIAPIIKKMQDDAFIEHVSLPVHSNESPDDEHASEVNIYNTSGPVELINQTHTMSDKQMDTENIHIVGSGQNQNISLEDLENLTNRESEPEPYDQTNTFQAIKGNENTLGQNIEQKDTNTGVTEEENNDNAGLSENAIKEDITSISAQQNVLCEISSLTTGPSLIEHPSSAGQNPDFKEDNVNTTENVENKNVEIHTQTQTKKKKKFGSARRPHGRQQPQTEGEDEEWKDPENTKENEYQIISLAVSSNLLTESQNNISDVSVDISDSHLTMKQKEIIKSDTEISTGEIDTSPAKLSLEPDQINTVISDEISSVEGLTDVNEQNETRRVNEEKDTVSAIANMQEMTPFIKEVHDNDFAAVKEQVSEIADDEHASEVSAYTTSGPVELIPQTHSMSDLQMTTESIHVIVSDQNQNLSEEHLENLTNRESEPEQYESTSPFVQIQEPKSSQVDVIKENVEFSSSEKRRKMGSTRRSLRGQIPGSDQKNKFQEIKEKENIQEQNMDQKDTNTGDTEEENNDTKEKINAGLTENIIKEDITSVSAQQNVLCEVSSLTTDLGFTTIEHPSSIGENPDFKEDNVNTPENVENKDAEIQTQMQTKKKKKFGSTRRPHGRQEPHAEGEDEELKDPENTEVIEHQIIIQAATSNLLTEPQNTISEVSCDIHDSPMTIEQKETIETESEIGTGVINTPPAILSPEAELINTVVLNEGSSVSGVSVKEEAESTLLNVQEMLTIITTIQDDDFTEHVSLPVKVRGNERADDECASERRTSSTSGPVELIPQTDSMSDVQINTENIHAFVSDQNQNISEEHLENSTNRESEREQCDQNNTFQALKEKEIIWEQNMEQKDANIRVTEEENNDTKEKVNTCLTENVFKEDIISVSAQQNVPCEVSSLTTDLGSTTIEHPSSARESPDFNRDKANTTENMENKNVEIHMQTQTQKKKKFGSTRRPHGRQQPRAEGEEGEWKDPENTEEIEHQIISQPASSNPLTDPKNTTSQVLLDIHDSPLTMEEKETIKSEVEICTGVIGTSAAILSPEADQMNIVVLDQRCSVEGLTDVKEQNEKPGISVKEDAESTLLNEQQLVPIITNTHDDDFAAVREHGKESTGGEHASEVSLCTTCGPVELTVVSDEGSSIEGLSENKEYNEKTGVNEVKDAESTISNDNEMTQVITKIHGDAFTEQSLPVKKHGNEGPEDEHAREGNSYPTCDPVELISQTHTMSYMQMNTENIHAVLSVQNKNIFEEHLDNITNRESEPEQYESTSPFVQTQEQKSSQVDVIKENVELFSSEKKRKMGSTRRSLGGQIPGSDQKNKFHAIKEIDNLQEQNMYQQDTNTGFIEEANNNTKEGTNAGLTENVGKEDITSVYAQQSSLSTDQGSTTIAQPVEHPELKDDDGNSIENVDNTSAEIHMEAHTKKKKKFGSTRRPQRRQQPHAEGEEGELRDSENTEETKVITQAVSSILLTESEKTTSEVSLAVHDSILTMEQKEMIQTEVEIGTGVIDASPVILSPEGDQIKTVVLHDVCTVEELTEIKPGDTEDEHAESALLNEQEITPLITELHGDAFAAVKEQVSESVDDEHASEVSAYTTSVPVELFPQTHILSDQQMNTENIHVIVSDQNLIISEEHLENPTNREPDPEQYESTSPFVHIQEPKSSQVDVITENVEFSSSEKKRKMGSTRRSLRGPGIEQKNKFQEIKEKENLQEQNMDQTDTNTGDTEEENNDTKEKINAGLTENIIKEDITPVSAQQNVLCEVSSLTTDLGFTTIEHPSSAGENPDIMEDNVNTPENVENENEEIHMQTQTKKKKKFGSTRRPHGRQELHAEREDEECKDSENAGEIKHHMITLPASSKLLTEPQNTIGELSLNIHDSTMSTKQKETIKSEVEIGTGVIDTSPAILSPEADQLKTGASDEVTNVEGLTEIKEQNRKTGINEEKDAETACINVQEMAPILTKIHSDAFAVVKEHNNESPEEHASEVHSYTTHGPVELIPQTHSMSDLQMNTENIHAVVSDQNQNISEEHLLNQTNREPEPEQYESTRPFVQIQDLKSSQDDVLKENVDFSSSEKRRKMGSTRKSLRGQIAGSDQKNKFQAIKEIEKIQEQNMDQKDNNTEITVKETNAVLTENAGKEDITSVCAQQYVLCEVSSLTTDLASTTIEHPSSNTGYPECKEDDGNSIENVDNTSAEIHMEAHTKKKKKFGSTRRPQRRQQPHAEGEEEEWKGPENTEETEHQVITQAVSSNLLTESQKTTSEGSVDIHDSASTTEQKEMIPSEVEIRTGVIDASPVILSPEGDQIKTVVLHDVCSVEELTEIKEQNEKSVDTEDENAESALLNEQEITPLITELHGDGFAAVKEHVSESVDDEHASEVSAYTTSGPVELIPQTHSMTDLQMNTENIHVIVSDQNQNLSEEHLENPTNRGPDPEQYESTSPFVHIQEPKSSQVDVIKENVEFSSSEKKRKMGSTRRSLRGPGIEQKNKFQEIKEKENLQEQNMDQIDTNTGDTEEENNDTKEEINAGLTENVIKEDITSVSAQQNVLCEVSSPTTVLGFTTIEHPSSAGENPDFKEDNVNTPEKVENKNAEINTQTQTKKKRKFGSTRRPHGKQQPQTEGEDEEWKDTENTETEHQVIIQAATSNLLTESQNTTSEMSADIHDSSLTMEPKETIKSEVEIRTGVINTPPAILSPEADQINTAVLDDVSSVEELTEIKEQNEKPGINDNEHAESAILNEQEITPMITELHDDGFAAVKEHVSESVDDEHASEVSAYTTSGPVELIPQTHSMTDLQMNTENIHVIVSDQNQNLSEEHLENPTNREPDPEQYESTSPFVHIQEPKSSQVDVIKESVGFRSSDKRRKMGSTRRSLRGPGIEQKNTFQEIEEKENLQEQNMGQKDINTVEGENNDTKEKINADLTENVIKEDITPVSAEQNVLCEVSSLNTDQVSTIIEHPVEHPELKDDDGNSIENVDNTSAEIQMEAHTKKKKKFGSTRRPQRRQQPHAEGEEEEWKDPENTEETEHQVITQAVSSNLLTESQKTTSEVSVDIYDSASTMEQKEMIISEVEIGTGVIDASPVILSPEGDQIKTVVLHDVCSVEELTEIKPGDTEDEHAESALLNEQEITPLITELHGDGFAAVKEHVSESVDDEHASEVSAYTTSGPVELIPQTHSMTDLQMNTENIHVIVSDQNQNLSEEHLENPTNRGPDPEQYESTSPFVHIQEPKSSQVDVIKENVEFSSSEKKRKMGSTRRSLRGPGIEQKNKFQEIKEKENLQEQNMDQIDTNTGDTEEENNDTKEEINAGLTENVIKEDITSVSAQQNVLCEVSSPTTVLGFTTIEHPSSAGENPDFKEDNVNTPEKVENKNAEINTQTQTKKKRKFGSTRRPHGKQQPQTEGEDEEWKDTENTETEHQVIIQAATSNLLTESQNTTSEMSADIHDSSLTMEPKETIKSEVEIRTGVINTPPAILSPEADQINTAVLDDVSSVEELTEIKEQNEKPGINDNEHAESAILNEQEITPMITELHDDGFAAVKEHVSESVDDEHASEVSAYTTSGPVELIPQTHSMTDLQMNTENIHVIVSDQNQNLSEEHLENPTNREPDPEQYESTSPFVHIQEPKSSQVDVIKESVGFRSSDKRRKMGSTRRSLRGPGIEQKNTFQEIEEKENLQEQNMGQKDINTVEGENNDTKEKINADLTENVIKEDITPVSAEQNVLCEVSSLNTDQVSTIIEHPVEHPELKDDDGNSIENVDNTSAEIQMEAHTKKKKKFGSTRRPQRRQQPHAEGEEEEWKDPENTEETEHQVITQAVSSNLLTESQKTTSEVSVDIYDSASTMEQKEMIISEVEIGTGVIDASPVILSPEGDQIKTVVLHDVCSVEELTEIKPGDTEDEHAESALLNEQKITPLITELHGDGFAAVKEQVSESVDDEHASEVSAYTTSGPVELIPQTHSMSDLQMNTENIHGIVSDQNQNLSEEHLENPTNRGPDPEQYESTSPFVHIQEPKSSQVDVIKKNVEFRSSEKKRKMGSTRRSLRGPGIEQKKSFQKIEEKENLQEQNMEQNTGVIEEENSEKINADLTENVIKEDITSVSAQQNVLCEVSSLTTDLGFTTIEHPSSAGENPDFKEDNVNTPENVENENAEIQTQMQTKKKKKFGSTRRPQRRQQPQTEGEDGEWKDPENAEEIERHIITQPASSNLPTDPQNTISEMSVHIHDSPLTVEQNETIKSEVEIGTTVINTPPVILSPDADQINTAVLENLTNRESESEQNESTRPFVQMQESKSSHVDVIKANVEFSGSEKRRKMGSTRKSLRGQITGSDQKNKFQEFKEKENIQEQNTDQKETNTENTKDENNDKKEETNAGITENVLKEDIPSVNAQQYVLCEVPSLTTDLGSPTIEHPSSATEHPEFKEVNESIIDNLKNAKAEIQTKKKKKLGSTRRAQGRLQPHGTEGKLNDVEDTEEMHNSDFNFCDPKTRKQESEPPIHNTLDQSECSLLSEIELYLNKSFESTLNTSDLNTNIPEFSDPMSDGSLQLPSSQSSQIHMEQSSPSRRRKMGSSRKMARNRHAEKVSDESRRSEQEKENLDYNNDKQSEPKREGTEEMKQTVELMPEVQALSQLNESSRQATEPLPEVRRKFGSSRKVKGSSHLGAFTNGDNENKTEVTKEKLRGSDPFYMSEPESTQISHPDSESRPGIEEVKEDTNASTEAGLVSLDTIRKTSSGVVSTGGRPKIDFDQWNEQIPDFGVAVYNIVMVGNSNVGKTSFIKRLQNGHFIPDYSATIGVDTFVQTVTFGSRTVKLYVWDTAGQERYHSITRQVFHKAQGLLLMYDITSSQSFQAVRAWISQVQEKAPPDVILMLLGNKNDRADREVQLKEGEDLSKEYDIDFMECSAATGENVLESLKTLAWLLVKQRVRKEEEHTTLQSKPQNKKKSGCC